MNGEKCFVAVPNKRHAKRWAYTHAAIALKAALGEGWPHNEGFCEEAADKLHEAICDIVRYLKIYGLKDDDPYIQRIKSVHGGPDRLVDEEKDSSPVTVENPIGVGMTYDRVLQTDVSSVFNPNRHRNRKKRKKIKKRRRR